MGGLQQDERLTQARPLLADGAALVCSKVRPLPIQKHYIILVKPYCEKGHMGTVTSRTGPYSFGTLFATTSTSIPRTSRIRSLIIDPCTISCKRVRSEWPITIWLTWCARA